ncbi:hypothetical protein VNO77_27636 [Canavalia gladiata]|uniref:Uncharacterized protein n=1 Tax=Canavalia gladiata TaxID=3824 RepID=A0AAN9KY78_CANGL
MALETRTKSRSAFWILAGLRSFPLSFSAFDLFLFASEVLPLEASSPSLQDRYPDTHFLGVPSLRTFPPEKKL